MIAANLKLQTFITSYAQRGNGILRLPPSGNGLQDRRHQGCEIGFVFENELKQKPEFAQDICNVHSFLVHVGGADRSGGASNTADHPAGGLCAPHSLADPTHSSGASPLASIPSNRRIPMHANAATTHRENAYSNALAVVTNPEHHAGNKDARLIAWAVLKAARGQSVHVENLQIFAQ